MARNHYNKCPHCEEYLLQLGFLDGYGNWIPDPEDLWACTCLDEIANGDFYARRFKRVNGSFKEVKPHEWRSDATGVH